MGQRQIVPGRDHHRRFGNAFLHVRGDPHGAVKSVVLVFIRGLNVDGPVSLGRIHPQSQVGERNDYQEDIPPSFHVIEIDCNLIRRAGSSVIGAH